LTVIAVGLALNWIFLARPRQSPPAADGPAIVVLPFTALGSTEQSLYLAHGLSEELIRNLMMFPSFRVYTSPIKLNGSSFVEPAKTGRDLGASYVVTGSVRDEASTVRVTAAMLEAATGRVLWTETYDRPLVPEALIRAERDLAGEIATALGQPYGIVNTDLSSQAATPAVSNMRSYICVLRAYGYRRGFERSQFDRVLACLEETVRQEPHYSDAWAMLGWLHLDAGRLGYGGNSTRASKYQIALDATSKAVQIEPNNALALKALAAVNHYLGRYDESEKLIRRALELNPYDPDAMAQLGWRLAVRGRFDEGIPILKEAIERTLSPPGWYFALIAIDLYLKADYKKMLQVADRTAANGTGFGQLLVAVGAGALGDRGRTQTALKKMTEYKELAADPAAFMHIHGATDEIVNALMAGLAKAHQVAASSKDGH
jgi:TolB-like protein